MTRLPERESITNPHLKSLVQPRRLLLRLLRGLHRGALHRLLLLPSDRGLRGLGRNLLGELLHPARRVHEFLLPGVKRMALRAELHVELLHGRTHTKHIAPRADDLGPREIRWVGIGLHKPQKDNKVP